MTSSRGWEGAVVRPSTRNGQSRSRTLAGQHAFEILEGRSPKAAVLTVEAAEGDLERLTRENKRQQRKDVGEALARPIAHELVERRFVVAAVEQAAARPHRPPHCRFAKDDIENPLPIDADSGIPLEDGRDRSRALEPHVEPIVVECQDERVCRALRDAHRKGPGELAPDPVVDARIQQRVGQLADALLRHLAQREEGVIGQRPGQQRDDMRDEPGAEPFLPRKHRYRALAVPLSQGPRVVHLVGWHR